MSVDIAGVERSRWKWINCCSFQPELWLSSVFIFSWWKPQFWLKAPINYLFSSSSVHSSDVYGKYPGKCRSISFFLTYFLSFYLSRFSFYINIVKIYVNSAHLPWHKNFWSAQNLSTSVAPSMSWDYIFDTDPYVAHWAKLSVNSNHDEIHY